MSDNEQVNKQEVEEQEQHGPAVGDSVVCIVEATDDKVVIFGIGEYKGEEVIPEKVAGTIGLMAVIKSKEEIPSPTVELEDGTLIYSDECHMGPAGEEYEQWLSDREVVTIDVEDVRNDEYKPLTAEPPTEQG